ncbi:DUF1653 domain-containing protein [Collinsella sp. AF08-23]|uniref:DUF1653 domain-containing protein n=2 Tax=unclassified Collinsella TaxID=2637548 RepID=UPI000E50A5FD|nr:DUF1653 domain-containing protein [Collinsella sp. AF08-23]
MVVASEVQQAVPVEGGIYRHFKGKEYQVIGTARHSEDGKLYVVYRALYGDCALYIRPLEMFMSPVDHFKYPLVSQEHRFELIRQGSPDECGKKL